MRFSEILEYKTGQFSKRSIKVPHRIDSILFHGLSQNCYQFLNKYTMPLIFRGGSYGGGGVKVFFINPAQSQRMSQNTSNEYTWILSTSSAWASYPKRSRSLVCTTDFHKATRYGDYDDNNVFAVVPYDNAKFGVCPAGDLWESFRTGLGGRTLATFNKELGGVIRSIGGQYSEASFTGFMKAFRQTNEKLAVGDLRAWEELARRRELDLLEEYIRQFNDQQLDGAAPRTSFAKFVVQLLDPSWNGFKVLGATEFKASKVEVWTDSPCYLIHQHEYESIRDAVLKSKPPEIQV